MACQTSCVLLVLCSCILWTTIHSIPLRGKGTTAKDLYTAVNYLTRLGYLSMPDPRIGQLRTNAELREGIKMFQSYASIPMTGIVDEKTMEMMKMPRCGMADFGRADWTKRRRRRYAIQGTTWQKKELTYMVEGGPSNTISETEVEQQIDNAFREWERISRLKFIKSTDPNSDILLRFRSGMHSDGYPFDGAGGMLAHGFYPHDNEGLSGDVHFDDDETWILKKEERGTDIYWTALHQIGHALGLDHSNYVDAVMYPFYTGFKDNLRLNEDDVKGIHFLYGRPVGGREESDVVTFMGQYGYLEPKDPRLGQFRTRDELVRGIKQLQEFAGLKVTGKINKETVRLIKKPRCGVPDFGPSDKMKRRKRYALHDSGWRKLHVTYRVLNTSTSELTKPQVRVAIRKAFDMWSEVSPLTFTEIFTGEAEIMISFESGDHDDGYHFDGRGDRIAHAFYPHSNVGEDGDIHFDDDEHWTLKKPDAGTNFMWTAVHEIGHAIGLDHTTYSDAIMYPYYTGYRPNLKLHEDDIMAIQAKYGKKPVSTTPPTLDPKLRFTGPSPCNTSIDAVVHSSDGNTYFFKDPYFWTLDKYNRLLGGRKIRDHWKKLHPRVQAAYTRRDGKTVFFKGKKYRVFEGTKLIEGPKYISEYGLPIELKRLDGAFTWGGNGKTYFFKRNKYWRYNEQMKKIDPGYPKNISEGWGAVRYPIDSVMTWKDGETYFFKGLNFAKHNWDLYKPEKISKLFFKQCHESGIQTTREEGNGVVKTTVFAPLITLLAILASLCNFW